MPNIDLLTIKMTPENIRVIEDEAISLFRSHSKAGPIDPDHWLEQYIPIVGEREEAEYDSVADKLLESDSWILQVLQCYRRAIRLAKLYLMKAALLGKEGTDPDETGFVSEGMKNIKLRSAQTQRENDFLESFLEYCRKHHRPNMGLPVSADGVEAYLMPEPKQSMAAEQQLSKNPSSSQKHDPREQSTKVDSTTSTTPTSTHKQTVLTDREREVFDTYRENLIKRMNQNPLELNVKLADLTLSLSLYAEKAENYKKRISAQALQKKAAEDEKRTRIREEEEAQRERERDERIAAWRKERTQKITFYLLTWIFCVISAVAIALVLFIEPITIFTIVPVAGICILYGCMVGWLGKSNGRSRGNCIVQTLIGVVLITIVVLIAFSILENVLLILIAQLVACMISIFAAIIVRGKVKQGD